MTDAQDRKKSSLAEKAADESAALLGWGLPVLFFAAALSCIVMTYMVFKIGITKDVWEHKGPIGDFVGGILNPVLTFLTFLGVLITIKLQVHEMRLSREELELTRDELRGSREAAAESAEALKKQVDAVDKQNFESTFFQMLGLFASIVRDIEIKDGNGNAVRGRQALQEMYQSLDYVIQNNIYEKPEPDRFQLLICSYRKFWLSYRQQLGHYFRFLENFLAFIDSADRVEGREYVSVVTASFSDYELMLIFYNTLAHDPKRYPWLLKKYRVLERLPQELLFAHEDQDLMEEVFRQTPG